MNADGEIEGLYQGGNWYDVGSRAKYQAACGAPEPGMAFLW
jgi:hypothetical protein